MSRIVAISGSSGFIGSRIRETLEEKGDIVLPIPRELLLRPNLLKFFMDENKPEVIIHCAAYGNMSHQGSSEATFQANVLGTWNLLTASNNINYKAFINFGSSSEYGRRQSAMKEESLPEPESMYACTKVASTFLSRSFAKTYNKPVATVRPFSVYGEGEADFRLIPTAIRCALYGEEMTLDAQALHDWIYIDDLVDGVLRVIDHAKTLQGQAINIGTGRQYKNSEIVNMIAEMLDTPIKTKLSLLRPQDSNMWVADNRTLKLLGWREGHDLWEGLSHCVEFYKAKYYAG